MKLTVKCLRKNARFCYAFDPDGDKTDNLSEVEGIILKIKGTRKLVEVRPVLEVVDDSRMIIAKLRFRVCNAAPEECP